MKPRLKQPLFSTLEQAKMKTQFASTMPAANVVRLYDVLWTMYYQPTDITEYQRCDNTEAMLDVLGHWLERQMGEVAFEVDPEHKLSDEPDEYVQLNLPGILDEDPIDTIKNSGNKT